MGNLKYSIACFFQQFRSIDRIIAPYPPFDRKRMREAISDFDIDFEAARPALDEDGNIVLWITGDEDFPDPWVEVWENDEDE